MVVDAKRWASRAEAGGSAAAEVLTDFKVPEVGEGRGSVFLFFSSISSYGGCFLKSLTGRFSGKGRKGKDRERERWRK